MWLEVIAIISFIMLMISIMMLKRKTLYSYKNKSDKTHEITAYIIRSNKQVIKHIVKVSTKFIYQDNTYIIKESCIFLKKIDGLLKQCIIYVEGNPNPYNFKTPNEGLTQDELNTIYGSEFYKILVNCQYIGKMIFIWLFIFITMVMSVLTFIFVLFGVML